MKRINLLFFSLIVAISAGAQTRTVQDALREAQSFVNTSVSYANRTQVNADMKLCYTVQMPERTDAAAYLFQVGEDGGFVLVSAQENSGTVLAYSDEGHIDVDNIPDNMQVWLQHYAEEIAWASTHSDLDAIATRPVGTASSSIDPLLGETVWNQDSPFNDGCPVDYNGKRCVTGCVATATAQIMYYWKTPTVGTGSHSYTWTMGNGSQKTLSVNFSNSTYDWGNMKPSYNAGYSTQQGQAVAKLMYDVGVASDMQYGSSSSGTSVQAAARALISYFGYDASMRMIRPEYTGNRAFADQVLAELQAKRPVLIGGSTRNNEGHAFVCDGYDGNGYFHINWGWGGMQNGFFALSALDPEKQGIGGAASGEGFSVNVRGVLGIMPDRGCEKSPSQLGTLSMELLTDTVTTLSSNVIIRLKEIRNIGLTDWDGGRVGFVLADEEYNIISWFNYKNAGNLSVIQYYPGEYDFSGVLSNLNSDGEYKLVPVFTDTDGSVYRISVSYGSLNEFPFTVKGNTVEFHLTPKEEVDYGIYNLEASAEGSTINISFESEAPYYQVKVYNENTTLFSRVVDDKTVSVSNVPDGEWTVWVRPVDEAVEYYLDDAVTTNVTVDTRDVITLNLLVNDEQMGSVTGAGTYLSGDEVVIEATANEDFEFVKWSDGNTDASRTIRFEKTGVSPRTETLTAEFGYIEAYAVRNLQASSEGSTVSIRFDSSSEYFQIKIYNAQTTLVDCTTDSNESTFGDVPDGEWTIMVRPYSPYGYYIGEAVSTSVVVDTRDVITLNLLVNDEEMGQVFGAGDYYSGETAHISVLAYEGYHFVTWDDGVAEPERDIVFEQEGISPRTVTLTAIFEADVPDGISDVGYADRNVRKYLHEGRIVIETQHHLYNSSGQIVK